MTLEETVLTTGLEFRYVGSPVESVIDFIAIGDRGILLGLDWWWRMGDPWETGNTVLFSDRLVKDPRGWSFASDPEIVLRPLADGEQAERFARMRRFMDINRGRYLSRLSDLREQAGGGYNFDPWIESVTARPTVDVVTEMQRRMLKSRKIGTLPLLEDGKQRDVLVIDENGNAATASGTLTLQSLADVWVQQFEEAPANDKPSIERFLMWAKDQRPYGPYTLSDPTFSQSDGEIEMIAGRQNSV